MIFSSGSVSRYGRNTRCALSQWRQWSSAGVLEQRRGRLVVDRGPLEAEEEQLGLEARGLLAQLRDERAAGGVGHVGGEAHVRVVEGARRDRLDPLVLVDRVGELGRRQGRDLAVVAVAEGAVGCLGLCEVALDAWVVA